MNKGCEGGLDDNSGRYHWPGWGGVKEVWMITEEDNTAVGLGRFG